MGVSSAEPLPTIRQPTLAMRTRLDTPDGNFALKTALPNGKFVDIADYANDLFDAAPLTLAKQIGVFLAG